MRTTFETPRRTVELDIDPEGAYAFLTDLEFLPEWYPGLDGVDVPPETTGPDVGDRFVERRALVPGVVAVPIPLEVTSARAGERFAVIAEQPGLGTVEGVFRFEPIDDESRTRVTVHHRITVSSPALAPAGKLALAVLTRGDHAQAEAMPGGLARWRGE